MLNNSKESPTGGIGRRAWLRTMSFFKVGVQVPRRAPLKNPPAFSPLHSRNTQTFKSLVQTPLKSLCFH